jgi:DNA-binding NarL/FixJ family response regulator
MAPALDPASTQIIAISSHFAGQTLAAAGHLHAHAALSKRIPPDELVGAVATGREVLG